LSRLSKTRSATSLQYQGLSRDVRALAGTTPAALAAQLASGGPADP